METTERLEKYFKELNPILKVRLPNSFPTYYPECEEFKECYIYSAFYDKPNRSTDIVEIIQYINEGSFTVIAGCIKEISCIDHVVARLDEFFKKRLKDYDGKPQKPQHI